MKKNKTILTLANDVLDHFKDDRNRIDIVFMSHTNGWDMHCKFSRFLGIRDNANWVKKKPSRPVKEQAKVYVKSSSAPNPNINN